MAKTDWQMDDAVKPEDLNELGQEINELKTDGNVTTPRVANKAVTKAKLADDVTIGGADDTMIGDRTINDATVPAGNTGKLTSLLSGLANMIKSITGGATWRTAPGMTIAAIKTILDAATNLATASTLMKRDANGRAKAAAPSAADDIARKAEVDAAISTAASDATAKVNTAQSTAISAAATDATNKVNTHAADAIKHITAAERTAWNAKETPIGAQAKADTAKSTAISTASVDATTKANAVQANLNTHTADTVKHITVAERTSWNAKPNKDGTLQTNLNAEMWKGWKRYISLAEIGLNNSSSVDDIFSAMAVNSVLEFISPGQAPPLYPYASAIVCFRKVSSNVMYGEFIRSVADTPTFFQSIYSNDRTIKWSGWIRGGLADGTLQDNFNAGMVNGFTLDQAVSSQAFPMFRNLNVKNNSSPNTLVLKPAEMEFTRDNANYFRASTAGGYFVFNINGDPTSSVNSPLMLGSDYSMKSKRNTLDDGNGNGSFAGVFTVPTPNVNTKTNQIANTNFVHAAIDASNSRGSIAPGDLNALITPGTYTMGSSGGSWSGYTNAPTAAYAYGIFIVFVDSTRVTQFYIPHNLSTSAASKGIWYRSKYTTDGSNFGAWDVTITKDSISEYAWANSIRIPANADLNSYVSEGQYFTYSSADARTVTNAPANVNSFNLTIKRNAAGWITQELTAITNIQFIRYRNGDTNTWGAWNRVGLYSPAFFDTPTVPTAPVGTNTQQIASTAFVEGSYTRKTLDVGDGGDLNKVVTSGFYRLRGTVVNGPPAAAYGQMIVSRGRDTIAQMVFHHSSNRMFVRAGNPSDVAGTGAWLPWREVAFLDSSITGNAATATKLATARTINGVAFDGSSDISNHSLVAKYIPSGANLNSYSTQGMYYCSSNADAASLTNSPTNLAFSLLVERHAGYKQTLTTYEPSNPVTYIRNFYSGTWGDWREISLLNSPKFTGNPTAPTAAVTVSDNQISTTKHVTDKLNNKVPMKIFNSLTTPVGATSGDLWFPPSS